MDEIQAVVQFAFLRRPLAELLQACTENALDLIVLKGAALAETVYSSPALRPFGDLDVLVRAEDASRAHALLLKLGYLCDADAWADVLAGRSSEANFFGSTKRGPVVVEVHTDLLNNPLLRRQARVDIPALWVRSVPVRLAGQDARVLGPEDQILHLCLHLAGHYFAAPKSVRDIAQVCAASSVDWPLFVLICQTAHAKLVGYSGLFAAAALYGTSIPLPVLRSLAPHFGRCRLEQLVAAQVAAGAELQPVSPRFLLLWLLLPRPEARAFAVRHLLFPARAWLHGHYYFDLPDTPLGRRLPTGVRLYAEHVRFLAAALRRGRK